MIHIDNSKIKAFPPGWETYICFSLLFDFDPKHYMVLKKGKLSKLNYDVNLDKAGLLSKFDKALKHLNKSDLVNRHLLALLPYESYHITVWGGVSPSNKKMLHGRYLAQFTEFEEIVPHVKDDRFELLLNWHHKSAFKPIIANSELVSEKNWDIELAFDQLNIWQSSALVAVLKPTNAISQAKLTAIISAREDLKNEFAHFGEVDRGRPLVLHVTLGYFANKQQGKQAERLLLKWEKTFRETVSDISITFKTISFHLFSDMATVYKLH